MDYTDILLHTVIFSFLQWACIIFVFRKVYTLKAGKRIRRENRPHCEACRGSSQQQRGAARTAAVPASARLTFWDSTSSTFPLISFSGFFGSFSSGTSFFSWGLGESSTKATVGLDLVTVVVKSCGSGMELHSETQRRWKLYKVSVLPYAGEAEYTSCPGPHAAGCDGRCRRASDARILEAFPWYYLKYQAT